MQHKCYHIHPRASARYYIGAIIMLTASLGHAVESDSDVIRSTVFPKESSSACHRIPSLLVSPSGCILAFSDFRRENHGDHHQRTDLVLRRSLDGGRTWLPAQTLAAEAEINHHSGPALADRQTGRIFKFYRVWPRAAKGNPDIHKAWEKDRTAFMAKGYGSFVIHSDDDGASWSQLRRFLMDLPEARSLQGIGNGVHGIQLASGRLVVHAWAFRRPLNKQEGKTDALSLFVYSDDHGETWIPGARWPVGHGSQEICYAPVGDSIYINRRNRGPWRESAVIRDPSSDIPQFNQDQQLPEPMCHAGLAAEGGSSQRLVFSNPPYSNHSGKYDGDLRHGLTLRLSDDGGKTWPLSRVVNEGLTGYSDLAWHKGRVLCLYETGPDRYDDGIAFISVDPAWIKAK